MPDMHSRRPLDAPLDSSLEVVALLQEHIVRDGSSCLMVTHDNRVLDKADRIVSMVDGASCPRHGARAGADLRDAVEIDFSQAGDVELSTWPKDGTTAVRRRRRPDPAGEWVPVLSAARGEVDVRVADAKARGSCQ